MCKQSKGDADREIVGEAITTADFPGKKMVVVSEDIDVLIILISLTLDSEEEYYFLKPATIEQAERKKSFSNRSLHKKLPNCEQFLLFLHAFTGSDATSGFFNMGKKKFFEIFELRPDLQEVAKVFTCEPNYEQILEAGIQCTLALYKDKSRDSHNLTSIQKLHQLRYTMFSVKNGKKIKKLKKDEEEVTINENPGSSKKNNQKPKNCELACLPPTADALGQNLKRVYFQVREWIGSILGQPNPLNPEEWGWKKIGNILQPVKITQPFAPEKILNIVFCRCQTGCGVLCGCRKSGIECSSTCVNCCDSTCTNTTRIQNPEDEIEEQEEECVQSEEVMQDEYFEESVEADLVTESDSDDEDDDEEC